MMSASSSQAASFVCKEMLAIPSVSLSLCKPLDTLLPPGKRPFGVSILYMGWDPHFGFQLYQSDPSGNYGGWKATCIGNNHQVCMWGVGVGVCVGGVHGYVEVTCGCM